MGYKVAKTDESGIKTGVLEVAQGSGITLTESDSQLEIANSAGGLTTKSGTTTTDGNGDATVTFNTEFSDTNYAIVLTCQDSGDTNVAMYNNKAVGGFTIKTENDQGGDEGSVPVDWLAIEYSNP